MCITIGNGGFNIHTVYYILYNYTAHLWASADQQGTDTFHNCEANYIQHLPSSLVCHLKFSFYFFS